MIKLFSFVSMNKNYKKKNYVNQSLRHSRILLMKEIRINQMNCLIIRALNMLFPLCFLKAWSEYLIAHFKPFFDVRINTPRANKLCKIYWHIVTKQRCTFLSHQTRMKLANGMVKEIRTAEEMISYYRDMRDDEYERLKANVLKGAKLKIGHLKISSILYGPKKMMKEFEQGL